MNEDTGGNYYVSAIDGPKVYLLAGPYETHQEALDLVDQCNELSQSLDDRAFWFAYGTCRVKDTEYVKPGILNDMLK